MKGRSQSKHNSKRATELETVKQKEKRAVFSRIVIGASFRKVKTDRVLRMLEKRLKETEV